MPIVNSYRTTIRPNGYPERQSSSTNQTSLRLSSLELFARDLRQNQRFRIGLRRISSQTTPPTTVTLSEKRRFRVERV